MRIYSTILAEHDARPIGAAELHQVIQCQPAGLGITSSQGAEGGTQVQEA
jgi:hypothetical protein